MRAGSTEHAQIAAAVAVDRRFGTELFVAAFEVDVPSQSPSQSPSVVTALLDAVARQAPSAASAACLQLTHAYLGAPHAKRAYASTLAMALGLSSGGGAGGGAAPTPVALVVVETLAACLQSTVDGVPDDSSVVDALVGASVDGRTATAWSMDAVATWFASTPWPQATRDAALAALVVTAVTRPRARNLRSLAAAVVRMDAGAGQGDCS